LSSNEQTQNAYQHVIQTNYKMVGSSHWVLNQNLIGYEQSYFKEPILFSDYEFVGGTMFMADFNLIKNWFVENNIFKRFYPEFKDGYIGDGSIAHQLERVFGCLIKISGNQILKLSTFKFLNVLSFLLR
jgi:hypothetical protein